MQQQKPVLLVLAAGMGSRYGGLKQLEPISKYNQLIIDYSVYDAKRAGFEEVIFVIRPEMEELFSETIGKRLEGQIKISYAHQTIDDIPQGCTLPEGRTKPWGTAHAALAARKLINGPFATINADDFYGADAFQILYNHLSTSQKGEDGKYHHSLVGYRLENTVTEHGTVSRGVCTVDEHNRLLKVEECPRIEKGEHAPRYTPNDGKDWITLPPETTVSMNLWGLDNHYLEEAWTRFEKFLHEMTDPLKNEYYLPTVTEQLLQDDKTEVEVLSSEDMWYGITYLEDRPSVVEAIQGMTQRGIYPENLWS
ncbi:MAG: sugar phosphate nucleotidyltransferase [Eubacteriales bacterium]